MATEVYELESFEPTPQVIDELQLVIPAKSENKNHSRDILPTSIAAGRILVDHMGFTMMVDGKEIDLTLTELKVLEILIINKGRYVDIQKLNEALYGIDLSSNGPYQIISYIRKKMGDDLRKVIKNKKSNGYKIDESSFI